VALLWLGQHRLDLPEPEVWLAAGAAPMENRLTRDEEEPPMNEQERYQLALQMRDKLWGADYAKQNPPASDFARDYKALAFRYAYGEVWSRPGLDLKVKRILTIGMLIALNRPDELKIHVKGALQANVSKDELGEILMHALVYCGAPTTNGAFRAASQVIEELEAGSKA
jgi:4-carboxymuconolactone decarboxylase